MMRPTTGLDVQLGRSLKSTPTVAASSSTANGSSPAASATFFLAREDEIEDNTNESAASELNDQIPKDSKYGVESLADTVSSQASADDQESTESVDPTSARSRSYISTSQISNTSQASQSHAQGTSPSVQQPRRTSRSSISQPQTPLFLASPAPGSSAPGSPKSFSTRSLRHSDSESAIDDTGSQALVSGGEEDEDVQPDLEDSAPQLIMPSIKMPSRRPFTEKGKNMGRIKLLIAGRASVGKTSLVKSIVQTCEDIVHVDPPSSIGGSSTGSQRTESTYRRYSHGKKKRSYEFYEVHASTKSYPSWRTDLEESKSLLRRRKSLGDTVLERNICFVDAPGFQEDTYDQQSVEPVISYIKAQASRTLNSSDMSNGDLVDLLSGNGGKMVNAVLYLIDGDVSPVDLECLHQLLPLTNVIPLLAQADNYTTDDIEVKKVSIKHALEQSNFKPFIFDTEDQASGIFAVSSATSDDAENMDASLLMSPDYVQPLVPSELPTLVKKLFDPESMACLRHTAAKKLTQWRNGQSLVGTNSPQGIFHSPSTSFALAKVADHTQREDRYAQVRLAKWASELQRSLQNERERYEALARGERAIWLTEKLGECVQDGTLRASPLSETSLVLSKGTRARHSAKYSVKYQRHVGAMLDPRDPLGLLDWSDQLQRRGWLVFQILGSFGVIGGIAVWLAKSRGSSGESLARWDWAWWSGSQ